MWCVITIFKWVCVFVSIRICVWNAHEQHMFESVCVCIHACKKNAYLHSVITCVDSLWPDWERQVCGFLNKLLCVLFTVSLPGKTRHTCTTQHYGLFKYHPSISHSRLLECLFKLWCLNLSIVGPLFKNCIIIGLFSFQRPYNLTLTELWHLATWGKKKSLAPWIVGNCSYLPTGKKK